MEYDSLCGSPSKGEDRKIVSSLLQDIRTAIANGETSLTVPDSLGLLENIREAWAKIQCPDDDAIKSAYNFVLHYVADADVIGNSFVYRRKMEEQLHEHVARLSNSRT